MKIDAHEFNGAYWGRICPWLMDHILLLEKLLSCDLLLQRRWLWTDRSHRTVIIIIVIALHLTLNLKLSFVPSI